MRFTVQSRTVGSYIVGDVLLDGVFFAQARDPIVAGKIAKYLNDRMAFDYDTYKSIVPHEAKIALISCTGLIAFDAYRSVKNNLRCLAS